MGKSVNGPDMLDVSQYIEAIQESQNCTVSLLVEVVGSGAGLYVRTAALAMSRTLTEMTPEWTASMVVHWPHRLHKDYIGALYALVAGLDHQIAKSSFQRELGLK